jgi:hypothetical protein
MDKRLEDIKEVITKDLHYCSNKSTIILKENDPGSNCKKVKIIASNNETLVLKLDSTINIDGSPVKKFPFFKYKTGTNCHDRICDYAIFHVKNNVLYIIICELKSDSPSNAISQIISGNNFIEFIFKVFARCKGFNFIPEPKLYLFTNSIVYKGSNIKSVKFGNINYNIYNYLCGEEYYLDSLISFKKK